MLAALALVQHVHGGGICMDAAVALVQEMHMFGILMLVPYWPPPRRGSKLRLLPRLVHPATRPCLLQHLHLLVPPYCMRAPSLRSVPAQAPRLGPSYKAGMG